MRDGPRGFGRDSSCPGLLRCRSCGTLLRIRGSHPLRRAVPCASPRIAPALERSYNPAAASPRWRFGLFPVRSPLLGESLLLSLPAGTKMFQFSAFASVLRTDDGIASAGLPHSDIRGSTGICPSPRLFAACHVLRRLREPRHPPCALPCSVMLLSSLTLGKALGLYFCISCVRMHRGASLLSPG